VTTCSAITHDGVPEVWTTINEYLDLTKDNGFFDLRRSEQNSYWLTETINEQLKNNFYSREDIAALLELNKKAVQNNELSPFAAAGILLERYFSSQPSKQ
jgi:LAO/AO transport system kinase